MDKDQQLAALCAAVPSADRHAAAAAQQRLDSLTKPRKSMGQIEDLLVRLAASTAQVCPTIEHNVVLLAAADHGVADEGVSAFPQAVTAQMVLNFLSGGAAINALAAAAGARIVLVDTGVVGHLDNHPLLHRAGSRRGSGNIAREAAMHHHEALDLLLAGAAMVNQVKEQSGGLHLLVPAEMGIANTTPAAALTSAFTGAPPDETVGRGTGIDDAMLAHKRNIVATALRRMHETTEVSQPWSQPLTMLCELGGLEIAFLAGAMLGAAAQRIPVLLDGYITTSAALVAAALAPDVAHHLIAAHRSQEPGHQVALARLGLTVEQGAGPLLQLDLRLGEGSGAALAMPLLSSAISMMRDMATFEQAGVHDRSDHDE